MRYKLVSHRSEPHYRVQTSVMSPSGNNCRSGNRHANSIARQYLSSSKACPNNTFSLYSNTSTQSQKRVRVWVLTSVAFWIHAICGQYATFPPSVTLPETFLISPTIPCKRLDCIFEPEHHTLPFTRKNPKCETHLSASDRTDDGCELSTRNGQCNVADSKYWSILVHRYRVLSVWVPGNLFVDFL